MSHLIQQVYSKGKRPGPAHTNRVGYGNGLYQVLAAWGCGIGGLNWDPLPRQRG